MSQKTKLIVTGMSGLIGTVLRRRAGDAELVNFDITEGIDLTNAEQILAEVGEHADAAAVIHLAAYTDVSAAFAQDGDESGLCYRLNVIGTRNIARACREHGLPLVHVSTDFVFDGEKQTAYTEDDEPLPIEWYGKTKLLAEAEAREAGRWVIGRTAFPYAAGESPRADLVRNLHAKLAAGQELKLFTDQIITPTFADDIADALLLLAREMGSDENVLGENPAGEIFHLVGSSSVTPHELGVAIAREFGFDENLVKPSLLEEYFKIDPRPRQRRQAVSNAKWSVFAAKHGLAAPVTLAEGLARVRESLED